MDEEKKEENPERDADLEEIKRVWGPVEADLIKSFLESQGITCLVRGHIVGFVYPLTVDGLGEFKILVRKQDARKAIELLNTPPADDESST